MNNETLYDKAKQNLAVASNLYQTMVPTDEVYLNYVGYHLQQALELVFKYQLEINGVSYPKTHDIDQLIRLANQNHVNLQLSEYIDDHSEMFSLWEARTRYILNYRLENRKIQRALFEIESYFDTLDNQLENELTSEYEITL